MNEDLSDDDIGLAALGSALMTPGMNGKRIELEAVWEVWTPHGYPTAKLAFDPVWADVSPSVLDGVDLVAYERASPELRSRLTRPSVVRRLKLDLLWSAWESRRHEEGFQAFHVAEGEWLEPYALYRSFVDMAGGEKDWRRWPEEWRGMDKVRKALVELAEYEPDRTAHLLGFHAFVQYVLWSQWRGLRKSMDVSGCRLATRVPFGIPWASCEGLEFADLLEEGGVHLPGLLGVPPPRGDSIDAWWRIQCERYAYVGQIFRRLELEPAQALLDHLLQNKKGVNFNGLLRPSREACQHARERLLEWAEVAGGCEWAVRLPGPVHKWKEELFLDAGWLVLKEEG